jgi:hypothetical protein
VPHLDEVVKEKEVAIEKLRLEIDALRLVCPLLHEDGDFNPTTFQSDDKGAGVKFGQKTDIVPPADERKACLARIRAQLGHRADKSAAPSARSVLLQFRQAALGASRALLKRIPSSRFLNKELPRRTLRSLFEGPGRASAA